MRKLFLCGRSEAGKTSLTQALKGEGLHYQKTQYVNSWDITIDTPGEYAESKGIARALGCFSFDSDVIGLLCSADEPFDLFGYGLGGASTRPVIGIITKIDLPDANVPMARSWLENAGCERIFPVSNVTGEGVDALIEYLNKKEEKLDFQEAVRRQQCGEKEWDFGEPDSAL